MSHEKRSDTSLQSEQRSNSPHSFLCALLPRFSFGHSLASCENGRHNSNVAVWQQLVSSPSGKAKIFSPTPKGQGTLIQGGNTHCYSTTRCVAISIFVIATLDLLQMNAITAIPSLLSSYCTTSRVAATYAWRHPLRGMLGIASPTLSARCGELFTLGRNQALKYSQY